MRIGWILSLSLWAACARTPQVAAPASIEGEASARRTDVEQQVDPDSSWRQIVLSNGVSVILDPNDRSPGSVTVLMALPSQTYGADPVVRARLDVAKALVDTSGDRGQQVASAVPDMEWEASPPWFLWGEVVHSGGILATAGQVRPAVAQLLEFVSRPVMDHGALGAVLEEELRREHDPHGWLRLERKLQMALHGHSIHRPATFEDVARVTSGELGELWSDEVADFGGAVFVLSGDLQQAEIDAVLHGQLEQLPARRKAIRPGPPPAPQMGLQPVVVTVGPGESGPYVLSFHVSTPVGWLRADERAEVLGRVLRARLQQRLRELGGLTVQAGLHGEPWLGRFVGGRVEIQGTDDRLDEVREAVRLTLDDLRREGVQVLEFHKHNEAAKEDLYSGFHGLLERPEALLSQAVGGVAPSQWMLPEDTHATLTRDEVQALADLVLDPSSSREAWVVPWEAEP